MPDHVVKSMTKESLITMMLMRCDHSFWGYLPKDRGLPTFLDNMDSSEQNNTEEIGIKKMKLE